MEENEKSFSQMASYFAMTIQQLRDAMMEKELPPDMIDGLISQYAENYWNNFFYMSRNK